MGGKHHKPCRENLLALTRLSSDMNTAHLRFELALVALSQVAIAELNGKPGEVSQILYHLGQSERHLHEMAKVLYELRELMQKKSYLDLHVPKALNLQSLGTQVHQQGLHASAADWTEAATVISTQGSWGMTLAIDRKVTVITTMTQELAKRVSVVEAIDGYLHLHDPLHSNEKCFNRELAKLHTVWASFQQFFLAAELISLEIQHLQAGVCFLQERPEDELVVA